MDTKGLFDFINVIYTNDKGKALIESLCKGKVRYRSFTQQMFSKRRAFEKSVFTCCLENPKFMEELLIYENRFKQSLEGYSKSSWFDVEYNRLDQPREFFTRKFHEVRRRQIELALEYIEKVKNPQLTNNNDSMGMERQPYYEGFSEDEINSLFDFLMERRYLDCETLREDFIYYFTGKGEQPQNILKWCQSNVQLAILIGTLCDKDDKLWAKAERIFGIAHLKSSYNNAPESTMNKSEIRSFVKDLLRKKKNI